MDEDREEEWLTQIASDVDPLTALYTVPRDEDKPERPYKGADCLVAIVAVGVL